MPREAELRDGLKRVRVWPALADEGVAGQVSVRPFDTQEKAAEAMADGLKRLLAMQVAKESKSLIETMPGLERVALLHATLGPQKEMVQDLASLASVMAFDESVTGAGLETKAPGRAEEVRSKAQFDARLDWGWDRLGTCGRRAFELAEAILASRQRVEAVLENAPTSTPGWKLRVSDLRSQIEHLVLPHFLGRTPYQWLVHYPRYLKAVERRLERVGLGGVEGEDRDLKEMEQVMPWWKLYLVRAEHARGRPRLLRDPALIQFRWMVEEFRVSVFAQHMGTAGAVSAKRLAGLWERVGSV